jgi:phosphatidylserine/phosphatidylglycerophosphate/cardiolipin synthase-like enzyme
MRWLCPALFALVAACSSASSDTTSPNAEEDDLTSSCSPTGARRPGIALSVLPDAGEAAFTDSLDKATKSIRVMVYMMGTDKVFATLTNKAQSGVDVRVILDGNAQRSFNQPAFDGLTKAGAKVKWSDPKFPFMHAKSFVVDGDEAVISTGNFPASLVAHERNYVAVDDNGADVRSLAAVFDADFAGTDPALTCTRLLVSPVNSKQRILDHINSAKTSLLVESLELADSDVIDAILAKKAAGLDVRVVLADPTWNKTNSNADTAKTFKGKSIDTRFIPKDRMLVHVKNVIVDGVRAYMGSENLTSTSLEKNREVGLLVTNKDAVSVMTSTFEGDFASATPF